MKAKAYWCVFILLFIAFVVVCKAISFVGQRNSLYGLNGVFVPSVGLDPEYEEYYGIDRRILQTAIELRLRRNGIKVLDKRPVPSSFLTLAVELYPKKHEDSEPKICAASVCLLFSQRATLIRNSSISVTGTTWKEGAIGIIQKDNVMTTLRSQIIDLVDMFSNDYLAVNPKEAEAKSKNYK